MVESKKYTAFVFGVAATLLVTTGVYFVVGGGTLSTTGFMKNTTRGKARGRLLVADVDEEMKVVADEMKVAEKGVKEMKDELKDEKADMKDVKGKLKDVKGELKDMKKETKEDRKSVKEMQDTMEAQLEKLQATIDKVDSKVEPPVNEKLDDQLDKMERVQKEMKDVKEMVSALLKLTTRLVGQAEHAVLVSDKKMEESGTLGLLPIE